MGFKISDQTDLTGYVQESDYGIVWNLGHVIDANTFYFDPGDSYLEIA